MFRYKIHIITPNKIVSQNKDTINDDNGIIFYYYTSKKIKCKEISNFDQTYLIANFNKSLVIRKIYNKIEKLFVQYLRNQLPDTIENFRGKCYMDIENNPLYRNFPNPMPPYHHKEVGLKFLQKPNSVVCYIEPTISIVDKGEHIYSITKENKMVDKYGIANHKELTEWANANVHNIEEIPIYVYVPNTKFSFQDLANKMENVMGKNNLHFLEQKREQLYTKTRTAN